jgi:hypothetical protein
VLSAFGQTSILTPVASLACHRNGRVVASGD